MQPYRFSFLFFFLIGSLVGCGQKGALYMENQTPNAQKAAAKKKKSASSSLDASKPRQEPGEDDGKEKLPELEPSPPN